MGTEKIDLEKKKEHKSAVIAFGNSYSKHIENEMNDYCFTGAVITMSNNETASFDDLPHHLYECDILYLIMEEGSLTKKNFELIGMIAAKRNPLIIGIFVGCQAHSGGIFLEKFKGVGKAFFLPALEKIYVYIAQVIYIIERALQPEEVIRLDIDDIRRIIVEENNSLWLGKSYGKNKATDIAIKYKMDRYREKIQDAENLIIIITGNVSLTDIDEAVSAVSNMDTKQLYVSVAQDNDNDNMAMLVINSYDENREVDLYSRLL